MNPGPTRDARSGISPDQARADYLERKIEEIRDAVDGSDDGADELHAALLRISRVLDRIPRQR